MTRNAVAIFSIAVPTTNVVKTTMETVVVTSKSLFRHSSLPRDDLWPSHGNRKESAKAMAPRMPLTHMTTDMLLLIFFRSRDNSAAN